jgi:hypothetical protein
MKAKDAIEGRLYNLKAKGQHKESKAVECYGTNHSNEFMRFLVFDEYGTRKIRMVLFTEDIEAV